MSSIEKFLSKQATSLVCSVFQSNAKKGLKNLFSKFQAKSKETIESEVVRDLGYLTSHYTVDKNQQIVYKSSVIFMKEFLSNCPSFIGKLVKDEESGKVFFDGKLMLDQNKLFIINEFISRTGIKLITSVPSHFNGAIKLLEVSDYTSTIFKSHFAGWDPRNKSIIDNFLPSLFGEALETESKYASFLFRKWIIGTAKRAMEPGVAFDGCLVLQGPAGVGKTSMFRELLPEPFSNRTGEVLCSIKNPQKFVEAIVGKTICCFDELSILSAPKVQEVFKQILSSRFIDVRLPWRRDPQRINLRAGFSATTNEEKFIKDRALSRRLWTIQLNNKSRINFEYLKSIQFNLWQEAVYLANSNENYLLSFEDQKLVEENNSKFLF